MYPNFEFAALAEAALDDPGLSRGQRDLQPHKQLEVRLLLEQVAANNSVIVRHLNTQDKGKES